MARAKVTYEFSDGDRLTVEFSVSESFPDSCAEAKANAKALWHDVLGVTVDTLAAGEGDE